jgi:hypothetical protein
MLVASFQSLATSTSATQPAPTRTQELTNRKIGTRYRLEDAGEEIARIVSRHRGR